MPRSHCKCSSTTDEILKPSQPINPNTPLSSLNNLVDHSDAKSQAVKPFDFIRRQDSNSIFWVHYWCWNLQKIYRSVVYQCPGDEEGRGLGFGMSMASPANASRLLWKRALHGGALERVRVVLVSPQQAGNVGSVCRVATNFDCNELWLVNPQCDFKGMEAHTMAANVTSRSKLERMHVTSSLSEALRDCSMAVAFTRRSGVLRIPDTQLASLCIPSPESLNLALVFGREDRGLTNSELMHCTHVCSIPSAYGAGSLNLSHAVAVVLSRLYEQVPQQQSQGPSAYLPPRSTNFKSLPGTASVEAVGNLMRRWELVLQACNQVTVTLGIPNYRMQERMLIHVRRMLLRSGPSLREVGFLHGFLTMVESVASRVQTSQTSQKTHSCQMGAQSIKST